LIAGLVSCGGDGFDNDLNGFFVGFAARRKSAFVADGGGIATLFQRVLRA